MQRRAHFDVLTKLPNRRYFVENLEHRILRCERYGDVTALLFLDVDNLKRTNDQFGHNVGDALLAKLGKILSANIRASDLVARIGGDEFAILLDNMDAEQVDQKIAALIDRIEKARLDVEGRELILSAAIGYCFIGPKDDISTLMSRADAAMYKVKRST